MAKVYEFMANGAEEIEALTTVDVLRRAGVEVVMVSVTGGISFTGAHGIEIQCDTTIEQASFGDADMLLLPGGLPGATNLLEHQGVREALSRHAADGGRIGAICAAPMVLGDLGLLRGKRATCYPGFEKYMDDAEYTADVYTVDGNIITGCGPAATLPYAYAILEMLGLKDSADDQREGMMFNRLIANAGKMK